MIRKLLVLLIILLAFLIGGNEGHYLPPPPTPGILYGNIIQSDPITVNEAIATLSFARNIHQWYLDNPEWMNSYTGGAAWQQQWRDAYDDMIELITILDANQGEDRVITIIVTDEGIFILEGDIWALAKEAGRVP